MSLTEHRRLARMVTRTFYGGDVKAEEGAPAAAPVRSRDKLGSAGLACKIVDTLCDDEVVRKYGGLWIKEDDIAAELHLHVKQVRRTLTVLEREHVVLRQTRREGHKERAAATAADMVRRAKDEGRPPPRIIASEIMKALGPGLHTYVYVTVDHGRLADTTALKLERMRRRLRDKIDVKETVLTYLCPDPGCGATYSSFDAAALLDARDACFKCRADRPDGRGTTAPCGAALVTKGFEGQDESARQANKKQLRAQLDRMTRQLEPLAAQLARCRAVRAPPFTSLDEWAYMRNASGQLALGKGDGLTLEERAAMLMPGVGGAGGRGSGTDGLFAGFATTGVEVVIEGEEGGAATKAEGGVGGARGGEGAAAAPPRETPVWLQRSAVPGVGAANGASGAVTGGSAAGSRAGAGGRGAGSRGAGISTTAPGGQTQAMVEMYAAILARSAGGKAAAAGASRLLSTPVVKAEPGVTGPEAAPAVAGTAPAEKEEDWEDA